MSSKARIWLAASVPSFSLAGCRKAVILRVALHPTQIGNLKLRLPYPLQSRLEFLVVANHLESRGGVPPYEDRSVSWSSEFIFRTRIVVLPMAVLSTRKRPSRSKWSSQRCCLHALTLPVNDAPIPLLQVGFQTGPGALQDARRAVGPRRWYSLCTPGPGRNALGGCAGKSRLSVNSPSF